MLSPTRRMRKLLKSTVLRPTFACRQHDLSLITSQDDESAQPSDRLMDVSLQAIAAARTIQLPDVSARLSQPPDFPAVWPGEHYRLLAGLVQTLQPKTIVEIGTYTGLSALAMRATLPLDSRIHTFDILPWDSIPHSHLRHDDFADGRLRQHLADLADPALFQEHAELLQSAELIFIDGPKNVTFEEQFLSLLNSLPLPANPLVVFDDIRLWNMLGIWRGIRHPKLDLTSFGHWSGTGLVDWSPNT